MILSCAYLMQFEHLNFNKKLRIQGFWKRIGVGVGSRGQKYSKNQSTGVEISSRVEKMEGMSGSPESESDTTAWLSILAWVANQLESTFTFALPIYLRAIVS